MNPIPSVQAILLCEKIIEEAGTHKKSLIGIFTGVSSATTPVPLAMGIYARMTDAEGTYSLRVDVVHLPTDKRIGSAAFPPLTSADRLKPMEIVVHIQQIAFPEFGKFEFQLFCDDVFLGHTSVDITQEGGPSDVSPN